MNINICVLWLETRGHIECQVYRVGRGGFKTKLHGFALAGYLLNPINETKSIIYTGCFNETTLCSADVNNNIHIKFDLLFR